MKKSNSRSIFFIVAAFGLTVVAIIADSSLQKKKKAANKETLGFDLQLFNINSKIKGDFNGDGKSEVAWLEYPKEDTDNQCVIKFSDSKIPSITVSQCAKGTLDNLGDLNNDGKDDIGILPSGFQSEWVSYRTYGMKSNKWQELIQPLPIYLEDENSLRHPISKLTQQKNKVLVQYNEMSGNGLTIKSKTLELKK